MAQQAFEWDVDFVRHSAIIEGDTLRELEEGHVTATATLERVPELDAVDHEYCAMAEGAYANDGETAWIEGRAYRLRWAEGASDGR